MYRILFLSSAGYGRGGASIALLNLVSYLREKVEVYVAFPTKGSLYSEFERIGVHCYCIGEFSLSIYPTSFNLLYFVKTFVGNLIKNRRAQQKLEELVDIIRPDIIHTNVGPLRIGYNVACKKNIPHVWHVREYIDKDFKFHPYPTFRYHVDKYKSKNNYNIVITEGVKSHFALGDNSYVIYDGVFPNHIRPRVADKENYFLFAGRIQQAKGVLELLSAYILYVKRGGTINLKLAGSLENHYFNRCSKIIHENNLCDKIEYLGLRDDIYELMSHAKALVVPSRSEGFGFITAEAMYNFCPVVGRDTSGTKEQFDLGKTQTGSEIGLRFINNEELVTRMFEIEKGVDDKMINNAHEVVMKNYTIEKCGEKIFKVYKMILSKNRII